VFGSVMMLFVLLPVAYFLPGPEGLGLHENSLDTLHMIASSPGLQVRRVWWRSWGGAVRGCAGAAGARMRPHTPTDTHTHTPTHTHTHERRSCWVWTCLRCSRTTCLACW
jgi:hypothetical protein